MQAAKTLGLVEGSKASPNEAGSTFGKISPCHVYSLHNLGGGHLKPRAMGNTAREIRHGRRQNNG
jgi:hypothetical protein